jgi:anti-sigma factor ChrR (cupin superfamily)
VLKCSDIPGLADAYIDREAPLARRVGIAVHLGMCGHCRTYVDSLRITRRLIAASQHAAADEAFVASLAGMRSGRDGGERSRRDDER